MTKQTRKHVEPKLGDGGFALSDGAAWFTVGSFSVRIYSDERGLNALSGNLGERTSRASRSASPTQTN